MTKKKLKDEIGDLKRERNASQKTKKRCGELFDSIPHSVFEIDRKSNITCANGAMYHSFGYDPEDMDANFTALRLLAAEDRQRAQIEIRQTFKEKGTNFLKYTAQTSTGSRFPAAVYFSPIVRGDKIVRLRGVLVNLAKPSREGEELARAPRPNSVRVQPAGAARDLNNLLAVIFYNICLAESLAGPNDAARNALAEAERSCLKAMDLIPDLIAVGGDRSKGNYFSSSAKTPETKTDEQVKSPADKIRVLLMDDDEMIRDMAKLMLNNMGYEVELAGAGSEAIRRYKDARQAGNPFDVVILDLSIRRGLGGKETIKALIEIDPDVKAILSSGSYDDPVFSNFGAYGFSAPLPKPYSMKELRETLEKILLT